MVLHFIGFEEFSQSYWNARMVFGPPAFFHRFWDQRAAYGGDIDPLTDTLIFAKGTETDTPTKWSYNDSENV